MKIYINREPIHGPWGGGAKTVNKLVSVLKDKGHEVVFKLGPNIDKIFCFDPRPNNYGESIFNLLEYKKNNSTKIIQRVGDVGTHGKPELTKLVKMNLNEVDHLIFPSKWAKDKIDFVGDNCDIIFNAPMKEFYNDRQSRESTMPVPTIITHHWSTNPKKGFKVYEEFDKYCQLTGLFEFYYIGQIPQSCRFKNYHPPLNASDLTQVLPKFDIYLTASEEEAGANHVLEAMASGLPVVYINSGGSIPEYCDGFGRQYSNFSELVDSVNHVAQNYSSYKRDVLKYGGTNDNTIEKYYKIIESI